MHTVLAFAAMAIPYSIKDAVGKRVLTEVIDKVPGFKVMCCDELSTRIIGSSLKLSDISDRGVATVENVMIEREPLPTMECIYFVEPCMVSTMAVCLYPTNMLMPVLQESWERIKNDFKDKDKPQYAKAHLFFTSKVRPAPNLQPLHQILPYARI